MKQRREATLGSGGRSFTPAGRAGASDPRRIARFLPLFLALLGPVATAGTGAQPGGSSLAPSSGPAVPSSDPAAASTGPAVPSSDPAAASTDPAVPSTDPAVPSSDPAAKSTDPGAASSVPAAPANDQLVPALPPDDAEARPDTTGSNEPWNEGFSSVDWDSVFAAYDSDFAQVPRNRFVPLFGVRYDKAEGVHLHGGVGAISLLPWVSRVEGRFGYAFARERPSASLLVRLGRGTDERLWVEGEIHDDVRSFGQHQPYGNTVLALVGGYDARQYLRERGGRVLLGYKPRRTWTLKAGFTRFRQDPLPAAEHFHLFGSDRWMRANVAAERHHANAVLLGLQRRPRYSRDVVVPGLYLRVAAAIHGGELLAGDREYTNARVHARYIRSLAGEDRLWLTASADVAGGDAPIQVLPDLGGEAGLRAFPPRTFLGNTSGYGRVEYELHRDVLAMTGIPYVEKARLLLIPFGEAGAVWGRPPELGGTRRVRELKDLRMPRSTEVHWDLGFGLRRIVETSGLLSYVQIDFAWPMGFDTGPARITVALSSKGFD
jgi:hypothetical protein